MLFLIQIKFPTVDPMDTSYFLARHTCSKVYFQKLLFSSLLEGLGTTNEGKTLPRGYMTFIQCRINIDAMSKLIQHHDFDTALS